MNENEPARFSRVSARGWAGGGWLRQIQLRSHDADGACPSRGRPGLSLGANTHELIHTLPHPRYDREAAPRGRTRSRIPAGSAAEPSPRRAGCPPRSRWRPPRGLDGVGTPRVSSRRRHPPATIITHPSPRVSPVSPSSSPPHSPPGATRGRGENSPCQRRSQRLAREEVASTGEVSRERRDDVGDAPDEPPDSAGPRRPPGSTRGAQEEEADAVARVPGAFSRALGRRGDDAGGDAAEAGVQRRGRVRLTGGRGGRVRGRARGRDDDAGVATDDAGEGERG